MSWSKLEAISGVLGKLYACSSNEASRCGVLNSILHETWGVNKLEPSFLSVSSICILFFNVVLIGLLI